MPTRVIEIFEHNNELQTRLYHPVRWENHLYVALSYCWGGPQPVTTSNENINTFAEGIPLQLLPKTIQDAIKTTRELDIRFLWLDSLCIIQDDGDDMAREIAQMPKIYSQAAVTIMASRAKTADEGFLHDRIVTEFPHLICELPYRCPEDRLGSIVLLSQDNESLHEPLDNRAWALQERVLSSRVLDFATRQIRWICPSVKYKEGYTDGWRKDGDYNPQTSTLIPEVFQQEFKQDKNRVSSARTLRYGSAIENWHYVITSYTSRALTVPTDRILAMSGIAERYSAVFQDDYFAGLWKFAFPFELLWKLGFPYHHLPRPKAYQAPSWSWGAINGKIDYTETLGMRHGENDRLNLLGYQAEPVNRDAPYGAVQFGHLTVKGSMRPALWIRKEENSAANDTESLRMRNLDGLDGALAARVSPDALEEEFSSGVVDSLPVHLLEVAQYGHPDTYGSMGLVLREIDGGLFARVGVFKFAAGYFGSWVPKMSKEEFKQRWAVQQRWFEGCEPEVITIA